MHLLNHNQLNRGKSSAEGQSAHIAPEEFMTLMRTCHGPRCLNTSLDYC